MRALERAALITDRDSFGSTVFFRLAGSIVLCATLLALLFDETRVSRPSVQLVLAFQYAVSATLTYALPLFFALTYQQEGLKRGSWENILGRKRARAGTQYVGVFLIATLIALIGLVANNVIFAISNVGFVAVTENLPAVLKFALEMEARRALLGGTLSICVMLIIDAWHEGRLASWRTMWPWGLALLPAILLGGIGWWERASASAMGRMAQGLKAQSLAESLMVHWRAGVIPALIGLVAAFYVIQSLIDEFPELEDNPT